jgi:hypothetical protein
MAPNADVKSGMCQEFFNDTLVHAHVSCDQQALAKHAKLGRRPLLQVGKVDGGSFP